MKNTWLTYASLALNILFIGFLFGSAAHPLPPRPFHGSEGRPPMEELFGKLSDQGRAFMREAFADIRAIHKDGREDIEKTRKAIADVIGSPDLDLAALDKAEGRMQALMEENMKRSRGHMRALLEKLTPQERKIIADHMRDGPPPPPPIP